MKVGEIYFKKNQYFIINSINSDFIYYHVFGLDDYYTYATITSIRMCDVERFDGEYIGCIKYNKDPFKFIADSLIVISNDMKSRSFKIKGEL